MAEPSVLSVPVLDAHGTFSSASLEDLSRAAEDATVAALQLKLQVQRIRARGGDPTVAVDAVRSATERLQGVARGVFDLAEGLAGRVR